MTIVTMAASVAPVADRTSEPLIGAGGGATRAGRRRTRPSHLARAVGKPLKAMHPPLGRADFALDHLECGRRAGEPFLRRLYQGVCRGTDARDEKQQHEEGADGTWQAQPVQTFHRVREHHGE